LAHKSLKKALDFLFKQIKLNKKAL